MVEKSDSKRGRTEGKKPGAEGGHLLNRVCHEELASRERRVPSPDSCVGSLRLLALQVRVCYCASRGAACTQGYHHLNILLPCIPTGPKYTLTQIYTPAGLGVILTASERSICSPRLRHARDLCEAVLTGFQASVKRGDQQY